MGKISSFKILTLLLEADFLVTLGSLFLSKVAVALSGKLGSTYALGRGLCGKSKASLSNEDVRPPFITVVAGFLIITVLAKGFFLRIPAATTIFLHPALDILSLTCFSHTGLTTSGFGQALEGHL